MVRNSVPAGSWTHRQTGGKSAGAITIAGLGGLFRGPGEDEINPQTLLPTYFYK